MTRSRSHCCGSRSWNAEPAAAMPGWHYSTWREHVNIAPLTSIGGLREHDTVSREPIKATFRLLAILLMLSGCAATPQVALDPCEKHLAAADTAAAGMPTPELAAVAREDGEAEFEGCVARHQEIEAKRRQISGNEIDITNVHAPEYPAPAVNPPATTEIPRNPGPDQQLPDWSSLMIAPPAQCNGEARLSLAGGRPCCAASRTRRVLRQNAVSGPETDLV
jgi:hypothetical protein